MRALTPFWTKNNFPIEMPFSLWKEMDRLFDEWPAANSTSERERAFLPSLEIAENEKQYTVSIDLPGLKKDQIKIEMHDKTLTFSGERKREEHFQDKQMRRMEKSYGFFKRSFALPENVEVDKIEAKYENGVLELNIPKSQPSPTKKIEVQ